MQIETKCLHEGYKSGNGEPLALPIYQSTTYTYDSTEHIGKLFDLTAPGHMYSRISNPTVGYVEEKIAALEGGVGCLMTTSGQAASFMSLFNILSAGDSFVAASKIYGGTVNLFAVTMKRMGIECIFVDEDADEAELQRAIKPNTKAVFAETLANPALSVCDIEKFARVAHKNGIPLIIDNTFPTPIFCRPFEWGADIVVHSTTKYLDGHAIQVGGAIVDSGNFDWTNGNFPSLTEPDESYHGIRYVESFGRAAYITKARVQLTRDLGVYPAAQAAFYVDLGIQTLAVRMQHTRSRVTEGCGIPCKPSQNKLCKLSRPRNRQISRAGNEIPSQRPKRRHEPFRERRRAAAVKFMDSLKLANNVVHVADVRTCVLHPASETHRQLTSEQLAAAGIDEALIRLSVGIENVDDIIDDISAALEA